MTEKELHINTVMDAILRKEIGIKDAADRIHKSEKQTRRIHERYCTEGSAGLIHKARGKPSNNKGDPTQYTPALEIIQERYHDYGPTLISEKLSEKHNISIPVSTLRLAMIQAGVWKGKTRKVTTKQFSARPRKASYGEMIQYDGSYHLWFEGRNATSYQCLLVSVDDATGEVSAKFAENEGLFETMKFWKEYALEKGKPQSIYLDKFATYKVNYPNATDDKELPTQFHRACNTLGIQLIFANTPQAKGRVERMNGTLQDRLVKALREEDISDIVSANIFLKEVFLPDFNKKFMVEARGESDLHLALRGDEREKLDQIFSKHISRKLANDFTIKIDNVFYQLYRKKGGGYTLRSGESVTVEKHLDGQIHISKNGVYIHHEISFERPLRGSKLLTAPACSSHLDEMKKRVGGMKKGSEEEDIKEGIKDIKEDIEIIQDEKKKPRDTYYARYGKAHPFIANCFH